MCREYEIKLCNFVLMICRRTLLEKHRRPFLGDDVRVRGGACPWFGSIKPRKEGPVAYVDRCLCNWCSSKCYLQTLRRMRTCRILNDESLMFCADLFDLPEMQLFYGREEMAPWMDQRRFNPYLQETYPGDRFMDQRRPYMDLESYPGTRFTERIRRPVDVEHFVEYEDKFMRYKRPEVRDDTYTAYNGGNQRHMKMRPLSGPRDDSFIEYRTQPPMRPSSGLRDDRWDAHTPPRVQNRSSGSRSQGQHRGFTRMRDGIPIPDEDEELYSYGGNSSGRNFSNEYPSRNLGFDYRDAVQADQYREHRKSQSNHRFHDDRYETQDYVAPRSHAGRYSYDAGEPIWEVNRLEVMPHGGGHGGQMMASNKSNFVDRDGGYVGQMMNNNNNMKSKSFKDRDGGFGGQMIRNKSQKFVDRDAGYSSAEESYGHESHQHQLQGRYSQASAKGLSQQYDSRDTDAGMKPSSHGNKQAVSKLKLHHNSNTIIPPVHQGAQSHTCLNWINQSSDAVCSDRCCVMRCTIR